jgi:hypothetical protein
MYELYNNNNLFKIEFDKNKHFYESQFKFANCFKPKYKLVINIFACATVEKYKNEILKINETWGKVAEELGIKVLFFLGEEQTDLKDDTIRAYEIRKNIEDLIAPYMHVSKLAAVADYIGRPELAINNNHVWLQLVLTFNPDIYHSTVCAKRSDVIFQLFKRFILDKASNDSQYDNIEDNPVEQLRLLFKNTEFQAKVKQVIEKIPSINDIVLASNNVSKDDDTQKRSSKKQKLISSLNVPGCVNVSKVDCEKWLQAQIVEVVSELKQIPKEPAEWFMLHLVFPFLNAHPSCVQLEESFKEVMAAFQNVNHALQFLSFVVKNQAWKDAFETRDWYLDVDLLSNDPEKQLQNAKKLDEALLNIIRLFSAADIDIFKPFDKTQTRVYESISSNPLDITEDPQLFEAKSKLETLFTNMSLLECALPASFDAWKRSETAFMTDLKSASPSTDLHFISIPKLIYLLLHSSTTIVDVMTEYKKQLSAQAKYFDNLKIALIRSAQVTSIDLQTNIVYLVPPELKQPQLHDVLTFLLASGIQLLSKNTAASQRFVGTWKTFVDDVQRQMKFKIAVQFTSVKVSKDKQADFEDEVYGNEMEFVDDEVEDGDDGVMNDE